MRNNLFKKRLLIGIIVLFIAVDLSVKGTINNEAKSLSVSYGNTLYVGGNGPGNYSKIQGAIDNASDGDTVFVYDDSSPYIETIVIDKPLNLVGESKDTTIIDGAGMDTVVNVLADNVMITGFTIQNSSRDNGCGIILQSDSIVIKNNIVKNSYFAGIWVDFCNNNKIIDNIITNDEFEDMYVIGVWVVGKYNEVTGNFISNLREGIVFEGSYHNIVSLNTVTGNMEGIGLWGFNRNNTIYGNNILNNDVGITVEMSTNNRIIENNLIGNIKNAVFTKSILQEIYSMIIISIIYKDLWLIKNYKVIGRNIFDRNYWDEPRKLPYPIFGQRGFIFYFIDIYDAVVFDWHPAQEPYDIEV